jgi:hypothetical protein
MNKNGTKDSKLKVGDLVAYKRTIPSQYQGVVVEEVSPRWVKVLWTGSHTFSEHKNDLLKIVSSKKE